MKKFLSLMQSIVLVIALVIPGTAPAKASSDLEKAISSAKSLLNIGGGYDTFNYSTSKQDEITVYYLYWHDSKNKLGDVNVTIDTKGRITSYHCYKGNTGEGKNSILPAVDKASALNTAKGFLSKVNPEAGEKAVYLETNSPLNINDPCYRFYFYRAENGIPFPQNSINIGVDIRTGEVQDYYCNWTDNLTFSSKDGAMSLESGRQTFTDKLGLKLVYKLNYNENNQAPYLVYANVYNNQYIDANTGEIIFGNGIYYSGGRGTESAAKSDAGMGGMVNLTPEEMDAVKNNASFINEASAEQTARKILGLDSSFTLNSINLYSTWWNRGDYTWNMSFSKEADEKTQYMSANISLDARTSEVISFNRYMGSADEQAVKYSKEQLLNIAKDYIKSMQPSKYNETEYTNWEEPVIPLVKADMPAQYSFKFTRKSNGAYFLNNGFDISVDNTTGNITGYTMTWYKGQLPSTKGAILPSMAHSILFNEVGFDLQYITVNPEEAESKMISPVKVQPAQVKLVYAVKSEKPSDIDAFSGRLLDSQGTPYEETTIASYSDIENCSMKNEINTLAMFGISLPGKEFKPDQNITQREFLYLLEKSTNYYIDVRFSEDGKSDDSLYKYVIGSNIINDGEKSPASNVSRQDAAKFVIRALGYERIAALNNLFALPFADRDSIDPELKGHAALAYGLNIIKCEDGYFRPSQYLTRAQAAVIIYNYINVR